MPVTFSIKRAYFAAGRPGAVRGKDFSAEGIAGFKKIGSFAGEANRK